MANATLGKFWLLDTAGVVVDTPVKVKTVSITFKLASAGEVELTEVDREGGVGVTFLHAATLGASSAGTDSITQVIPVDNWVDGLNVKTITDIAKLIVNVE